MILKGKRYREDRIGELEYTYHCRFLKYLDDDVDDDGDGDDEGEDYDCSCESFQCRATGFTCAQS